MDTVDTEKEPYQEPELTKHEPLVDITGQVVSGGSKHHHIENPG